MSKTIDQRNKIIKCLNLSYIKFSSVNVAFFVLKVLKCLKTMKPV